MFELTAAEAGHVVGDNAAFDTINAKGRVFLDSIVQKEDGLIPHFCSRVNKICRLVLNLLMLAISLLKLAMKVVNDSPVKLRRDLSRSRLAGIQHPENPSYGSPVRRNG